MVATRSSYRSTALGSGHPSDWRPMNPCQGRSQAWLGGYMCKAASPFAVVLWSQTGLGGGHARLQDQGTGGMAPVAMPFVSADLRRRVHDGRYLTS